MGKVVVATCMAPREQNLGFLATMHSVKEHVSDLVLIGSFLNRELCMMVMSDLMKHMDVHWIELKPDLGLQRSIQMKEAFDNLGTAKGVLFLDDDAFITGEEIEELVSLANSPSYSCSVGFQPGLMKDIKKLKGRVAFDFFCTYLPREVALSVLYDLDVHKVLVKIKRGGECFLLDWVLRHRYGVVINTLVQGPYHAYRQDKFKVWGGWSFEKWDSLYQAVDKCSTIKEFEQLFIKEKLIDA